MKIESKIVNSLRPKSIFILPAKALPDDTSSGFAGIIIKLLPEESCR
jgi:hypothetical protein